MSRLRRTASLEAEDVSGKTTIEKEHVWYLRGINFDQLEKIARKSELQEQWSLMGPGANLRVRAIDDNFFVMTGKTWQEGVAGKAETQLETNRAMFDVFKRVANSGLIKRRYEVESQGHVFEVDIFFVGHDPNNRPAEWCKVDLEVKDLNSAHPVLPFDADEVIKDSPHNRTPELDERIAHLYKTFFTATK